MSADYENGVFVTTNEPDSQSVDPATTTYYFSNVTPEVQANGDVIIFGPGMPEDDDEVIFPAGVWLKVEIVP